MNAKHIGNKIDIGRNLKFFRKMNGMSQSELGEKVFPEYKAAFAKINKLETGQQMATLQDIKILSEIFEIDEDELTTKKFDSSFTINEKLFEIVPKLKHYFDLLNHIAELGNIAPKLIVATLYEMGNDPDIQKLPPQPKHPKIKKNIVDK